MSKIWFLALVCAFLVACGNASTPPTPTLIPKIIETASVTPTELPTPTETATPPPSPTIDVRLSPDDWQDWPVVPTANPEMKALFQQGLALGNNPAAFTKIGDGEISTVWFLTQYDQGPTNYHLGDYTDLESVIEHFSGSFERVGTAAGRGFNTTIILGPVLAGTQGCNQGESHLGCELRVYHPSFAILSLGTNQVWQPEVFDPELRQIVQRLIKAGVIPILSTKADNLEGNYRIDTLIARIAYDYKLPLWNFWRVVQPLSAHGLQADHEHLTYAYSDFNNPVSFLYAWPWRNLTALQTLDSVYRGVTSQP